MQGFHTEYVEDIGEVEFHAKIWQEDVGICDYEFQGQKGHDTCMVTECGNIKWDQNLYTPQENALVKKHFEKFEDIIKEAIINQTYGK